MHPAPVPRACYVLLLLASLVLLAPTRCLCAPAPKHFTYKILATKQHPPQHFTQGFAFREFDGALCEGTGGAGSSLLTVYGADARGQPTQPLFSTKLAASDFGEGVTSFLGNLYQATWKSQLVHVYESKHLERLETRRAPDVLAEGWGLATAPEHDAIIMSDGSAWLFWAVPNSSFPSFDVVKKLVVRDCARNGSLVSGLNELEVVPLNLTHPEQVARLRMSDAPPDYDAMPGRNPPGGLVWGNIYGTQCIAAADPSTGHVRAYVHLDGLNPKSRHHDQVANGIAYRLSDSDSVWVTGKNWHHMYQIQLVEQSAPPRGFPGNCETIWNQYVRTAAAGV